MAKIVLGFGTSHSPMLQLEASEWETQVAYDKVNPHLLAPDGQRRSFDELAASPRPEVLAELDKTRLDGKGRMVAAALDKLRLFIREAHLDALIVVGDDQSEHLHSDNAPAILVYHGEGLVNTIAPPALPGSTLEKMQAGYYEESEERVYPVHQTLACSLIRGLIERDFDIAVSDRLPRPRAIGHAFQFVFRRLLDAASPTPIVPILLNTYNPPNQPTPRRCFALGKAIAETIACCQDDLRIGIAASGGLSHFMVDEVLDRTVLNSLARKDENTLISLPLPQLESGSSEIRNWITAAGACEDLSFSEIAYVPAYRSVAGTGTGLAFGVWQ